MVAAAQCRRLVVLAVGLGLAFAGLIYRLIDVQVLRHEELAARAKVNTRSTQLSEPRRGDVRDIRGNVLATSEFVKTVCADPSLIDPWQADVARALAPLLGAAEGELIERLQLRGHANEKGQWTTNHYVVLKHKVKPELWDQIKRTMARLPLSGDEKRFTKTEQAAAKALRAEAVFVDPVDDQLRVYPGGMLAAHVLGFVGPSDPDAKDHPAARTIGKDGIELAMDTVLRGVSGWRETETDRRKRELVTYRERDVVARPGLNVVLTLDARLQDIAETGLVEAMRLHSPISASAMMIRPKTGEILALANLPAYDPNRPGDASPESRRDRVIGINAEPGSTFKIVVVAAALNEGIVSLSDQFDCEQGQFMYAGRLLHDHKKYGILSVESIITKSSNIGAAKIGINLGQPRLYDYIRRFGFGERTGIVLPGEEHGLVHALPDWNKLSISRIPMGHEIAVTPLQMVMAMSAIANGGRLMRPMLVDHLEDDRGQVVARYRPQFVRQVVSDAAAQKMVEALKTVVTTNGTAPGARLARYCVAGKTGTANKPGGPTGYWPDKFFSSFIGFFPADDPEICISVVLDEPKNGHFGGEVAGPIFKSIAEQAANYLNIRPTPLPPPMVSSALAVAAPVQTLTPGRSGRTF